MNIMHKIGFAWAENCYNKLPTVMAHSISIPYPSTSLTSYTLYKPMHRPAILMIKLQTPAIIWHAPRIIILVALSLDMSAMICLKKKKWIQWMQSGNGDRMQAIMYRSWMLVFLYNDWSCFYFEWSWLYHKHTTT